MVWYCWRKDWKIHLLGRHVRSTGQKDKGPPQHRTSSSAPSLEAALRPLCRAAGRDNDSGE